MKLELKYLAPYLPYGLKVITTGKELSKNLTVYRVSSATDYNVGVTDDKGSKYGLTLMQTKPILRPLSDLTKEYTDIMTEYSDFENAYISKTNSNGVYDEVVFINTEDKTHLSDIIFQLNYLFENHFDVFGLIEKGLAIDINTLK